MKKLNVLLLVSVFVLSITSSYAIETGDIPASRVAISGWEDVQFDDSGDWEIVDVTTKGVLPNQETDMALAIQKMIMSGSGKTIYKFPAGSYHIDTSVIIKKGDFQIVGEGIATKFLLRGGENPPMLIVQGSRDGNALKLQKDIKRGDDIITLASVSGLTVGDFIFIKQSNGERSYDIDNQIVKILAINGNTLSIDMKMGLPFTIAKATAQRLVMRENVKLSDFYIERLTEPAVREGKLRLAYVYNGLISSIESNKTLAQHIEINDSRNVLIFDNYIHGNFGRDKSGGYQGGIVLNRSTRINIINNRLHNLRHHVAMQFGSDHCVIAYNRTSKHNHYGDYGQHNNKGCHNNLFEGNYGSELYDDWNIKAWGSPYAMWFRNHAINKIGTEYLGQMHMSIIGNELRVGESGIKLAAPENDNYVAANIVNIDKENGNGEMLWGDLSENATIPNSLFLTEKPDYLDKWPLYGPGTEGTGTKEPVDNPYDVIYSLTELPDGFTFAAAEKETIKVEGTMDIAYGANGHYNVLYDQTEDVICGNDVFGDPISGIKKQCYCMKSGVSAIDDEAEAVPLISIFPNPNNGTFTILNQSSQTCIYEVYTLNGLLVTQGEFSAASQLVQVDAVASGMYFVKVTIDSTSRMERILIHN